MQVLRRWLIDDGGLIPLVVVLTFAVVAAVVWRDARRQRRWEDELLRRPKLPCIHRFVRIVATFHADGALKERYPQCADCGERVLKNVVFKED